ncbi:hypothetical protein ACRAWG_31395 [Methylobacterium sp. P31]
MMGAGRNYPPLPPEYRHVNLLAADALAQAIREASELTAGVGRTERLKKQSRDLVEKALADYGGPCSQAYADVLSAYVSAPPGGRDALFLAVAYRAVGVSQPSRTPDPSSPDNDAHAPLPQSDPAELLAWARSTLGRLTRQERS